MKKILCVILLPLLVAVFAASPTQAASQFRTDYIKALEASNFTALEYYGRTGGKEIPVEVRAILKEAREAASFDDKMHLVDIAASMAAMYQHWHNDATLVTEVEAFQREEIKKETARRAEAEKWVKLESVPGNFVLMERMKEMEAKGLPPVLFPHWVHRLYYDCKACHQGVFRMKRGANDLAQAKIAAGEQCGVCHDGKASFSASDNCKRCHRAGASADDPLLDPMKYDLKKIKEAATRLGSGWAPEKLKDGRFPLDRLGQIDWTALKESGAYAPLKAVGKDAKDEVRDNTIYFEPRLTFVKGVLFSHTTHSSRIECAACHKEIFDDVLGSTKTSMQEMSTGTACGACHGKTAFKLADCNRCHTLPQGKPVEGALKRAAQPAGK